MKQHNAIQSIVSAIKADEFIDACFLKGSFARHENDAYSDIDLYCLVSPENKTAVLERRMTYLQTYQSILHVEEVYFVCPQLVCIYEDGLHLDLYVTTLDELTEDDDILVLLDPKGFLNHYQSKKLRLSNLEMANHIHEYALTLLEFVQSYRRGDYVFAFRLLNHLLMHYTYILRYFKNPIKSKIGIKGFTKELNGRDVDQYMTLVRLVKYETSLLACKTITSMVHDLMMNLPIAIAEAINFDLFLFAKQEILRLGEVKL